MLPARSLTAVLPALAALALVAAAPAAPAWAQKAAASQGASQSASQGDDRADRELRVERHGTADDEVTLEVSVEGWVETTTATVRVAADLAVEAGGFGVARRDLVATLQGFGTGAEWRIVDFGKLGDDAGFERWRLVAEARVPEASLAALAGKTKEATRPGRALAVASIEYRPTLAEREAVTDRLRAEVYERVAREVAALNEVFADRRFRVRMIDFTNSFQPEPRMMAMARAESASAAKFADAGGGGLAGAEKAQVTARVMLAAVVADE